MVLIFSLFVCMLVLKCSKEVVNCLTLLTLSCFVFLHFVHITMCILWIYVADAKQRHSDIHTELDYLTAG